MNTEQPTESVWFPNIASELKAMVDVDQEMRSRADTEDFWDDSIDTRNTERMKEIVAEIGWPTISKVGKGGAEHAWLLVQHADHDVAFQEHCLQLMKDSIDDVDPVDVAYLEDRVRVNQGKGQLYGTQFTQENNQHIPRTIEDEEHVDERRTALGMDPLAEQIAHMYEKYPFDTENDK